MTTLAPLRSVTWTDFHDTTLTSTQITDISNAVANEAVITSALSAAIANMPSGPFASGAVAMPTGRHISINGGTINQDLATAQLLAANYVGKVVQYYAADGFTVMNVLHNGTTLTYPTTQAVANLPSSSFLTNTTPTYYATFNSQAAARAAIANAPINCAFSYTTPSGSVRFVVKNSIGTVYLSSTTDTPTELTAAGVTSILVSPLNPANRAAGLELNEIYKIARAISPTFTLASINSLAGTSYTGAEVFTSAMAQNLLNAISTNKSIVASKIPVEQGGGVKYVNGQWYLAGRVASFFDVYLRVRVNQLVNIDKGTTDYINSIQKRNNLITQANYFLSQLNAIMPTTTDGTVSFERIFNGGPTVLRPAFIAKYGFDPFVRFAPTAWAAIANKDVWGNVTSGSFTQAQMEAWATEIKSFISSKQTDTTSDQTQLQTLADKRTEVFDAVTNVTKSNGQISADIGRNMT